MRKSLVFFAFCILSTSLFAQCWQTVSPGHAHTLAIKSDGTLWAWGFNAEAQLGDGTTVDKSSPIQIGTASNWKSISAGNNHSLAIKTDGTLWAWGSNFWGQVGNGSFGNQRNTLQQIGTATNWKSISAGLGFSVAIKTDGTLWGWGDNFYGQLGFSTSAFSPTQVGASTNWESVSAGGNHTLAIKTDGTIWASGYNGEGQLGDGTTANKSTFTKIGTASNWKSVKTGYGFSLALNADGMLWSWGNNSNGQLGNGTFIGNTLPTQIGTAADWKSISAGYVNSLAIKNNGTLWSWGYSIGGVVFGDDENRISPTQLGTDSNWESITSGDYHSMAFKTLGTLWGWGDNTWGRLGDETWVDQREPKLTLPVAPEGDIHQAFCNAATVANLQASGENIKWYGTPTEGTPLPPATVLLNNTHYYGSQTSYCESEARLDVTVLINTTPTDPPTGAASQVFCSGVELKDIIVTGSNITWYSLPVGGTALSNFTPLSNGSTYYATQTIASCVSNVRLPVSVQVNFTAAPTGAAVQSICEGSKFNAIAVNGENIKWYVSSWGGAPLPAAANLSNGTHFYASQTINGCESERLDVFITLRQNTTPVPTVSNSSEWSIISARSSFSMALKKDGTIWGWGWGENWIFANGSLVHKKRPTLIGESDNWKFVSISTEHVIGLKADGTMWGWGANYAGQVWQGISESYIQYPTQIGTQLDWKTVGTGRFHNIAIKEDSTLWSWGLDSYGAMGNGVGGYDHYVPTKIGTSDTWTQVSVGHVHNLAIKSDGSLWGWGGNWEGQVGDGTMFDQGEVTRIGNSNDWQSAAAGYYYSLAIKKDGTLWSWGKHQYGVLGNGKESGNTVRPTQVGTGNDWKSVSAGIESALAIKTDGTLWAWGYNYYYTLGDGTQVTRTVPVKIGTDTDWVSVSAGNRNSLALKADGSLWSWGHNSSGVSHVGDGGKIPVKSPKRIDSDSQNFCTGSTLESINVAGSTIRWYADEFDLEQIVPQTLLEDKAHYFVTQNVNGCESPRLAVTTIEKIPQPRGSEIQKFCGGGTLADLSAIGTNVQWYSSVSGGALLPAHTALENGTHYFATQQLGTCESTLRLDVQVFINSEQTAVPTGPAVQVVCSGATVSTLQVSGLEINWYDELTGGIPVLPSTPLLDGHHYYASQTLNSCESSTRLKVTAISAAIPTAPMLQTHCSGSTIENLTVEGTSIKWYNASTDGILLPASTPLMTASHYYATQTLNGCESLTRLDVLVSLNTTAPPSGISTQTMCSGASVETLNVSGININWYNVSSGGTSLPFTTPLVEGHYYATQTIDNCESARFDVTVQAVPAPTGDLNQLFCSGSMIGDLTVIGTDIRWYDAASGGSPLTSTTILLDGAHYYATQGMASCESINRLKVVSSVNEIPLAPTGISPQIFESGQTIADLEVSGSNIKWYSTAEDAATRTNALPASHELISGATYYATQTVLSCESIESLLVIISIITDIESTEPLSKFYPNPIHDFLEITCASTIETITVVNSIGQPILNKAVNSNHTQLDFRLLENGIYIVQLQLRGKIVSRKVIKQ